MPARRSQVKVPDGKLVRLDAVCEQHIISDIKISGDFFVHPEEALFTIERGLDGLGLTGTEEDLAHKVGLVVSDSGAVLIGFTTDDIVSLLKELRC
jgi:lipoate-protein ligase A